MIYENVELNPNHSDILFLCTSMDKDTTNGKRESCTKTMSRVSKSQKKIQSFFLMYDGQNAQQKRGKLQVMFIGK